MCFLLTKVEVKVLSGFCKYGAKIKCTVEILLYVQGIKIEVPRLVYLGASQLHALPDVAVALS